MAQQFRALAILPEDHMAVHNHLSFKFQEIQHLLLASMGHQAQVVSDLSV